MTAGLTYATCRAQALAHLAKQDHAAAIKAQAAKLARNQAAPSLSDWGTGGNTPPLRWRAVDAQAARQRVAVTHHAAFDAVSLSAGPGAHAYAGSPGTALMQIAALVLARDGGR